MYLAVFCKDRINSQVVTVELNRGWNSRLGFSVQSHPDSGQSYISAVYNDSVAARDGRLRRGDVILQASTKNVKLYSKRARATHYLDIRPRRRATAEM